MTPEQFLKELAGQLMPGFQQIGENLKTTSVNFNALFDRMDRDHEQIRANFEAVHRDMLVTQENIQTTHRDIQALLEITRSHERRLGLLEREAPTGPIRKETKA